MNHLKGSIKEKELFPSLVAILLAAALVIAGYSAIAEAAYPEKGKTIQIIVPFSPGGSTDVQTRIVADFMQKDLGVNVEVIDKPGAGSQLGLTQLATSKPDGYTIGATNNPTTMGVYMMPARKAAFNRKSFEPIGLFVFDPETISVKADGPYKTFKDLIDAAKAKPRTVKATTNGLFSDDHMSIMVVQQATGAKFAIVHFDGSAEEVVALLGGKTDAAFMGMGATLSQVKAGTMRHLAIMDEVSPVPGTPSLKELGIDFVMGSSRGLSAPKGTPKEAIKVLEASLGRAMKDPSVVKKITGMGTPIKYLKAADYAKFWENLEKQLMPTIDMMQEDQGIEVKK